MSEQATSIQEPGSEPTQAPYPGTRTTTDGSGAVVWVETHISEGACAYPITPSTNMGVDYAAAVANGKRNLWDEALEFLEPESEHSSASAAEGFAVAGGRVTNFTSGQGLVLMKEVLYTISGKRLPAVFHIGARALTSHSLNVHAGHDDVMAVADTGWGIVFARNAQCVADLALIARRAAENSHTPFMVCQDGFLTTHTLETTRLPEPEFMRQFVGDPAERVPSLMDPSRPVMSGVVQNQDAYMKGKVAQRHFTDRAALHLREAMETFAQATGRRLDPVTTYCMEGAEVAIVAMGSMIETARATVDWLRSRGDLRVGVVEVVCFRPFPTAEIVEALRDVRAAAVIERMDNPLAQSNPLIAEIKAAFADAITDMPGVPSVSRIPILHAGVAGLGSRDVRPGHFLSVLKALYERGPRTFVLGVDHELSLPDAVDPDVRPPGAFSMRGYSVGGFGSVTTNKVIATIAADVFDLYVQAYPLYGSEKKGLPTRYFLTAAPSAIRTHCELRHVEFVPLNSLNALNLGNPLEGITRGGTVFVQTTEKEPADVWGQVPGYARRAIREGGLRLLYLDAASIAADVSSRADLQVRMQGIVLLGVFLAANPFSEERDIAHDELMVSVEKSLRTFFGKAGEQVVQDNLVCVRRGMEEVLEVPADVMRATAERRAEAMGGLTVGELMSSGVTTCGLGTTLPDVRKLMLDEQSSCVLIVDEKGQMQGILSMTDLARAHTLERRLDPELPDLRVEHLMTHDVLTTHPTEGLSAAVDRLVERRVTRLIVTEGGGSNRPIGTLSTEDLTAAEPLYAQWVK